MNELRRIVDVARQADRDGRAAVLATVVKVAGSAYRRPGARMIFPEGGEPVGMVSGGCLEADLAERARGVLASGEARTIVYDMRSPDDIVWGLGLGCNGEVRVLLERLEPSAGPGHLDFLERCLGERRPGVVATLFEGDAGGEPAVGLHLTLDADGKTGGSLEEAGLRARLLEEARRALAERRSTVVRHESAGATVEALVEYVAPTVSLLVFGAGSDAVPLVRFAAELGWQITVADNRPVHVKPERFPGADTVRLVRFDALDPETLPIDADTPVVVMTHHFLNDLELIRFLLPTAAPYLGFLGPRQRTENLLAELAKLGGEPTAEQLARLHGPVGIDIGAETPEEIALAVLAEIRAVLSDRDGGFLRDRAGPLHE